MISTISETKVVGNPDCVIKYNEGYIVATYTLDQETATKSGSLIYFQNDSIYKVQEINAGVLDLKLMENNLVSCCSDGNLKIFREQQNADIKVSSNCCSYLALDGSVVYTSTLDGFIHAVDMNTLMITSESYNPYEIWFIAVSDNKLFVPVSMGKLKIRDLRENTYLGLLNLHETDICSLLISNNTVYSGSFDGKIAVSDLRNLSTSVEKYDIGGGVWRIIKNHDGFITANMEEGFKFFNDRSVSVIKTESLAYGLEEIQSNKFIGCSFYDSKVINFEYIIN